MFTLNKLSFKRYQEIHIYITQKILVLSYRLIHKMQIAHLVTNLGHFLN